MPENDGVIELANKRFIIIGLQGSGKTTLAKSILRGVDRHIVYDPMGEYPANQGFRNFVPDDMDSPAEMDDFIGNVVIPWQPDLFILDEGSRYIPHNPKRLPRNLSRMVDLSRHWAISWGVIARRPSQIHTDVRELAHYIFVFGLHGSNDIKTLDNWYAGMGQVVRSLPEYHFAVLENGNRLTTHIPVAHNVE